MTSALLASELTSLIAESKRKNAELRTAAEKSLQELKSITVTSEQQLAADLRARPAFVEPFLIACRTHHPSRFAGSGIACLQRLVVSGALPRSRLQDALEAFNSCSHLGLDVQLKILQALPTLLQNYTAELVGHLLGGALQLCASLQAAKECTVSGVAAATLQQLVTSVFDKVWTEDKHHDVDANAHATTTEVPGDDGPLHLKPAAFDAYRVFRDLALAADGRQTRFVRFSALPPDSSLELIWSSIDSNPELFTHHQELLAIIRANLFPLIVRALSERLPFSVTLRLFRILHLLLDRYMSRFAGDCEVALNLATQLLETDSAPPWKRAMVLEILKDFFDDSSHVIDAYSTFDARPGGKPIVQDILSAFVRMSTEKPAVIGLGQQSTVPTGPSSLAQSATEQATLEAAGGMAGVISSALGVAESSVAGVSSQWSLPRSPCMDQLDKNEAPPLPETYPYALLLECLNGLSDSLARVVLPLTVQHERTRGRKDSNDASDRTRSSSFRTRAVPANPLEAKDAPYAGKVQVVAGLVDRCWPAVLATCSTFLNAALDDHYFRNLIKAYQRFAQVAGLLRLNTPRDALMTTLAKTAVPPHVPNAVLVSAGPDIAKSPTAEIPRVFSNPRGLLSVDSSLVSQASTISSEAGRRPTTDLVRPTLSVRNLLCLRALLNLAIALGPTLASAFAVVVGALKQADMALSATTPQQLSRQSSFVAKSTHTDPPSVVQAFSAEVAAVEAAASRLLESTADYPNDAFLNVLQTFCQLLQGRIDGISSPIIPSSLRSIDASTPPRTPVAERRTFSGLPWVSTIAEMELRDYHFVIPKLGNLAELNVARFASDQPDASGWNVLIEQLMSISKSSDTPKEARRSATDVLVKLAEAVVVDVTKEDSEERATIQRRATAVLLRLVDRGRDQADEHLAGDLEVQARALAALQAILERCGDSIVAGWDTIVAVIASAFEHDNNVKQKTEDAEIHMDWNRVAFDLVSPQVARIAFAALQLLCSDFLEALPLNVMQSVVELMHRFMCQDEDLNAALTTITMASNVSDHLFNSFSSEELSKFAQGAREFDDLAEELQPLLPSSKPALWLLVLLRLRDVAGRPSRELRNAAFQTICNVFKNHSEELPPDAWDFLLRSTLLHVARSDSCLYLQAEHESREDSAESRINPDDELSKSIIIGNTSVIAQNICLIEQITKLPSLWEMILSMIERYLDVEKRSLTATVWSSLSKILQSISPDASLWRGPIYRTASLWSKRMPHFSRQSDHGTRKDSNQDAFTAYAEAGDEVYRLTKDAMSLSQTRSMIDNLYDCVKESDGPLYGADMNSVSPLQGKTLALFKKMQHEVPNAVSCLITVASKMSQLHHDMTDGTKSAHGPTFVAISSETISWLQELLLSSNADDECGGFLQALQALRRIIELKYTYRLEHKQESLWRKATTTTLTLIKSALHAGLLETSATELWVEMIGVASGIVMAHGIEHVKEDKQKVHDDQQFDMASFDTLRALITPHLRDPKLPRDVRTAYARALFDASIVHQPESGEVPEAEESPLTNLARIRRGRVKHVPFSQREEMAYVCFQELVALARKEDGAEDRASLARAATPFLILRLAIPIRAYIADQPLRGRKPQPLSELEELLWSFETIKDVEIHAEVRAVEEIATAEKALYAFLIQAVRTAADPWSGAEEVLLPLQSVLTALATK